MTIQRRLEISLWGRYVPGVSLRRRNLAQPDHWPQTQAS